MHSYKFEDNGAILGLSLRRNDGWSIPINPENSMLIRFVREARDGAEVKKADGSPWEYSDEAVQALGLTTPA